MTDVPIPSAVPAPPSGAVSGAPLRMPVPGRRAGPDAGRLQRILAIAWPVVLTNFLQSLTLFVDLFMVAALGAVALASVGLATQVFFLSVALGTGLSAGVVALTSRAVGAGDSREEARIVSTATLLVILVGVPLGALGFVFAGHLMGLLGAPPGVAGGGTAYLRIVFAALPAELFNLVAAGILTARGRTRDTLAVNLLMNAVNLALDYLLIFGNHGFPRLGVTGAALGTALSWLAGAVAFHVLLRRTTAPAPAGTRLWDGGLARRILRVGSPSAAEDTLLSLGFMVYTLLILGFGASALAAHQIGLRVQSFAFMPGFGFSAAAAALVGQGLGAKRPDEAEENGWYCIGLCLTVMVALSVPLFLLAEPVARFVSGGDAPTVALGVTWIHLIALAIPAIAVHFSAAGSLRGAGDTRWPLLVSFVGLWGVRIPLAYVLAHGLMWGLTGIWVSYIVEYYLRAFLTARRFRQGAWKAIEV